MGRRKDAPAHQAAKGYPGRRKSREQKAAIELAAKAQQAADQVAGQRDPFAAPAMFRQAPAYYARALEVWNDTIRGLKLMGRLDSRYSPSIAIYCVAVQEWETACKHIRQHGFVQKVKRTTGDSWLRQNPMLDVRGAAESTIRDKAREFGLSPLFDQELLKVQSFNRSAGQQADLFGESDEGRPSETVPEAQRPQAEDPHDLMNRADSPPPDLLQ
ncbi:P27 family phage terminase small subunit [Bosea sp. FBZP-16]|uniref:P27 family phage terminase small subunit n=1 Tax=Bosea sp. FBZP-16 TaxID=2065382 RepID=UPI000C30DF10|nr:P27 family phage terminase small subunit [Bosea sp. FBZP-16]